MSNVGFVLLAAALLWLIGATIRSSGRKNLFALAVMALVVGLIAGFEIAWKWYIPELRGVLGDRIQSIRQEELLATTVSLSALIKLENGREPEARSFLASQVADYYRRLKSTQPLSPEQKKLLESLEAGMAKSEALRPKLQEAREH